MGQRNRRAILATLAFGVAAVHATVMRVVHGAPVVEVLWMCHLAPVVLGVGCALGSARIASIGTTWTALGLPLWFANLVASGGRFEPTPTLIHVGTFAIGVVAARVLGWDRSAWWRASIATIALSAFTRLVPAAEQQDVNLAFRVWPGLEGIFPSYGAFVAFLILGVPVAFYGFGRLLALAAAEGRRGQRDRTRSAS